MHSRNSSNDVDAGRLAKLRNFAHGVREGSLVQAEVQGQGYIGQALGLSDVLAALYGDQLNYDPDNPDWEDRDRCQMSMGHYGLALYAALAQAGFFPKDELKTYATDDSRLPMSAMASYTPGVEISSGSLGHGLTIANGVAMGLKRKNSEAFVYNMLSDGELDEGSTWEAAAVAAHHGLNNVIAIVDFNNQQADGKSQDMLRIEPVEDKFEAFGWSVRRVNGNDLEAVLAALIELRNEESVRPRILIADTKLGCGVEFLEEREKLHFMKVADGEWSKAHNELMEYYNNER